MSMMSDAAEGGRTDSSDNLGRPITGEPQDPEGGYETMPGPTVRDLNHIPVPYGRDAPDRLPDHGRSGRKRREHIMDDRDLDDRGYLVDMDVTSLGNEKRRMGWDPLAPPPTWITRVAHRVRSTRSGTRGDDDFGSVPADGSMP